MAPDGDATELDVSRLIGALVIALKPDYVIETGAYRGDTTEIIGHALAFLGRGRLLSVEIDETRAAVVRQRVSGLPVTVVTGKAEDVMPDSPVDMLFVDSALDARMREVRAFRPYALPRCVILAHDSALPTYEPGVSEFFASMTAAVDDGIVQPWMRLPTPRGLAITRYR